MKKSKAEGYIVKSDRRQLEHNNMLQYCCINYKIKVSEEALTGRWHPWLILFYLTGKPPHWTASKGHWSGNGIWWRWLCDPRGGRWQNGRFGSHGQQWALRSPGLPPSLSLTGSNRWPVWTPSPLGWTCYYSEPVGVTVGYVNAKKHDQRTKNCIFKIVSHLVHKKYEFFFSTNRCKGAQNGQNLRGKPIIRAGVVMPNPSCCAVAKDMIFHLWILPIAFTHDKQDNYTEKAIFTLLCYIASFYKVYVPVKFAASLEDGCVPSVAQHSSVQLSVDSGNLKNIPLNHY